MYYPKRWRDRAHNVTRVAFQYGIGLGNELLGGEEGGIKGTPIGMRTVVGTVGALTAAMGSDLGADAFYAALGSGAELAGKKTVEYWRGKREPTKTEQPAAAEPAKAEVPAVVQPIQAAAPEKEAPRPSIVVVTPSPRLSVQGGVSADVFDVLSPELKQQIEAEIEQRIAKKRGKRVAKKQQTEEVVVEVGGASAGAQRTG